ncbi:MAG: flagellar biosynthesis protein FlgB [Hyphomonadaceae bacterium]
MDLAQSPFFAVLRAQLHYLGERQRLVAENIANASTPGYAPRDTDAKSFARTLEAIAQPAQAGFVRLARTQQGHLAGAGGGAGDVRIVKAADSETTIDGNAVILEDQMLKQAETRSAYETGIALYQKGLQMVRMAIKAPGR